MKREREATPPKSEDAGGAMNDEEYQTLTPLEREILHSEQEKAGLLTFPVVDNDGTPEAVITLVQLKAIFCQQLPKMPKEYISRLVYDRQHVSLACVFNGEVVGGITYRPVASQALAEIVFCAVSAKHQVQGYGTRIMNQIKEECKRAGIEGMLTYADNHAVGYFRKQGFKKQVTMKRERWQGYLKDYEGATLMECLVDPSIDYLSTRQLAEQQRKAVVQRIAELHGPSSNGGGTIGSRSSASEAAAEWASPRLEVRLRGEVVSTSDYLKQLFEAVSTHADAWPFQNPVSVVDAPDYHVVIQSPIDLSMIRQRLQGGGKPYYITPDMLLADLYLMCENCRTYNDSSTTYWEAARRLEEFVRAYATDTVTKRLTPE